MRLWLLVATLLFDFILKYLSGDNPGQLLKRTLSMGAIFAIVLFHRTLGSYICRQIIRVA